MARGSKFWFLLETDCNLLASCILYTCQKWQLFVTSISISFISILIFWSIFFFSHIYFFLIWQVCLLLSCVSPSFMPNFSSSNANVFSWRRARILYLWEMFVFYPQQNVLIWNSDDDGRLEKCLEGASANILNLLISILELIYQAFTSKSMVFFFFTRKLKLTYVISRRLHISFHGTWSKILISARNR